MLQCCYKVSVYKWFIIHTFILNALLECVLYTLYFKLPKMFYLSQLFTNSYVCFLLQELDLLQYIYYILSHALSTPKTTFNKCTSRLTVVSREAKKKQHACASSGPRDHYSELFTRMAALKF